MFKWTETLQNWFERERRDFPWRQNLTPYRVWVAEVMLQQTRASVVVPYFLRWMEAFPNISALATAKLENILKQWEGLGYYSRARHLHAAAKQIVSEFRGEIPSSEEELSRLKGVGPYTRAAILSFAFHQKKAAVDGNVLRVIARLFAIEEVVDRRSVQQKIQALAEAALPDDKPWVIAEALIELGATVCTKQPKCLVCPVQSHCLSFQKQIQHKIPIKLPKIPVTSLFRAAIVLRHANRFFVKKQPQGSLMGDLYEFPYFPSSATIPSFREIQERIERELFLQADFFQILPIIHHTFTRYKALLYPYLFTVRSLCSYPEDGEWLTLEELEKKPFSSGHKQILRFLQQQ